MSRFAPAAIAIMIHAASAIDAGPANSGPAAITAGTYIVEPSHTRVQSTVSHMGFTNWYGDFAAPAAAFASIQKMLPPASSR